MAHVGRRYIRTEGVKQDGVITSGSGQQRSFHQCAFNSRRRSRLHLLSFLPHFSLVAIHDEADRDPNLCDTRKGVLQELLMGIVQLRVHTDTKQQAPPG
ncbi:unnamed protein product [Sphagnum troendelagicum]|uniref:Uncharacterized protein n=1 Tax=Sphagnum troendelagicum TaxID=128251 RepID=A0ABP0TRV2_9BRYO